MVKSDGHIDLVFRDGLKNFEVLPPVDVWDNVRSEISTSGKGAWFFRIAAGVAAVVSLGLLAFLVGMRTSENAFSTMVAEQTIEPESEFSIVDGAENIPVLAALTQPVSAGAEDDLAPSGAASISRDKADQAKQLLNTTPVLSNNNFDKISLDFQKTEDNVIGRRIAGNSPAEVLMNMDYETGPNPEGSKWMLGAKISPTYLSTNLKADNNTISGQKGDEAALISYTGGLSLVYSVGNRLSLQTGIYYSSLGRQVSDINSYSGFANYAESKGEKIFGIATSTGTIASTNRDIFLVDASGSRITSLGSAKDFDPEKAGLNEFGSSLRQNFEYIEVPFMLSYKLIDKKVDFNIMGGMSYSLLLDNEVYAVSDGSVIPIGSMEDLAGLLLSSSFGMSMHYSLNENFSLNLEPSIRYYLNSDGSLSASNNPFAFGIFSGVYYKF